jgi:purine-cytosine permease-like protein
MLIVQVYAGNTIVLYSSGLTLQAIGVKIVRWQSVLVDSIIVGGLVAIVTLSSEFNTIISDFLLFMLVWFAPWTVIFLVDLWLRRGRYDVASLRDGRGIYWRTGGFHLPGVVAQLGGMAAAAAWLDTSVWKGPLSRATDGADMSVWTGLVAAGALYFIMGRASVRREARASRGASVRPVADDDAES